MMKRHEWIRFATGMAIFLLMAALLAVGAAGCGSGANAAEGPLALTEADNGKAFTVKVGDTVTVEVIGNPTTGYQWSADLTAEDAALLKAAGEPEYVADKVAEGMVGSGGTYRFTFTAVAKGEAQISLIYWRSFEPDVEPIATFTAAVTIE
jgi:inhibitor of cysteine peptidase